ncbi:MAG: hypothetical protein EA409_02565 [Saprospirales bacterium]|nr:MAG: hypothetical protein EA409_02565 [Saprospirales bacterium]
MTEYGRNLSKKINNYLEKNFDAIASKYPNITGAYCYWKHTNNEKTGRYAIVFQVTQKDANLPAHKRLPKKMRIPVGKNKFKDIPTDMVESGELELCHYSPGVTVRNVDTPNSPGRCGIIGYREESNSRQYYLITCMHVIGKKYFDMPEKDNRNIRIRARNGTCIAQVKNPFRDIVSGVEPSKPSAKFALGFFTNNLDAAIALIPNDGNIRINRGIKHGLNINSVRFDSVFRKLELPLDVFNLTDNRFNIPSGTIKYEPVAARFKSPIITNSHITIFNLYQILNYQCNLGDSGSPVYFKERGGASIVGIVVGRDNSSTYVLPLERILKTFNLNI